jgi:hypothetical protein
VHLEEVDVPLSENEQRLLEQMERALYAEDPKFASAMRGAARRPGTGRRLLFGVGGIVVGLVLLLVGVFEKRVALTLTLSVVGFVFMLAGTVYAVSTKRRHGPTGVVGASGKVRPPTGATRRRRGSFMQRVEERWDRRRDQR